MKNRKFIILAGIFGLLLVYVLITQTGEKGFNTVDLPDFKPPLVEDLAKVELRQGDKIIVFDKKNDQWMITEPFEFAADKNKMNTLTRSIADMRLTDKISENPEAITDYGLNSTVANYIAMVDKEGKKTECYLGNPNSSGSHTFARLSNDNSVYQILGNFNYHFDRHAEDWRSLQIFDFQHNQVNSVVIEMKGKTPLELVKNQDVEEDIVEGSANTPAALKTRTVWKIKGRDKPLNETKVNQLINAYSRLAGTAIVDEPKSTGQPLGIVSVQTATAHYRLSIVAFHKENKKYIVKSDRSPVYYEVPEYQGQNFMKTSNDFN